jgi:hypothetical protein
MIIHAHAAFSFTVKYNECRADLQPNFIPGQPATRLFRNSSTDFPAENTPPNPHVGNPGRQRRENRVDFAGANRYYRFLSKATGISYQFRRLFSGTNSGRGTGRTIKRRIWNEVLKSTIGM